MLSSLPETIEYNMNTIKTLYTLTLYGEPFTAMP